MFVNIHSSLKIYCLCHRNHTKLDNKTGAWDKFKIFSRYMNNQVISMRENYSYINRSKSVFKNKA